ncbi:MAG TPA: DUF6527 family protein [Candidatus Binatia bacterium]|nr:DUF6527 family protein [Candidatus Binatia bacterium]
MSKIHHMGGDRYAFRCPGCHCGHYFKANGTEEPQWNWNGNLDKPTLMPSIMVNRGTHTQCHSFITKGQIRFLADSKHGLSGMTVDLPDWEEDDV